MEHTVVTQPMSVRREAAGRQVRLAWIAWARTQPDPKPSWLTPWEQLDEPDKEADRLIADRLFRWARVEMPPVCEAVERGADAPCGAVATHHGHWRGWRYVCTRHADEAADTVYQGLIHSGEITTPYGKRRTWVAPFDWIVR